MGGRVYQNKPKLAKFQVPCAIHYVGKEKRRESFLCSARYDYPENQPASFLWGILRELYPALPGFAASLPLS